MTGVPEQYNHWCPLSTCVIYSSLDAFADLQPILHIFRASSVQI
jgi:hypothetical protein